MTRPLVIGIGNPYRRDDGVGLAVLEAVAAEVSEFADVVEELGEPAALVDRWTGRELVVVVDAVVTGAVPGEVVVREFGRAAESGLAPRSTRSSHGLGIGEAVELGRVLERLPERLRFVGVEVADTTSGTGLTPAVTAAVDAVVAEVLDALS